MVAAGRLQCTGQHISPDQREAGALARQWRRAVAGVADQCHPVSGPVVHADLANGIEVEVGSVAHGREQPRDLPALPGERGFEQLLLLADVAVVVIEVREAKKKMALASVLSLALVTVTDLPGAT